MQAKLLFYAALIAIWVASAVPASAVEWRGLTLSCKVIKGGYDVWGGDADYSLMIRFVNPRDHQPVTIRMHELYNAVLNINFQNVESGQEVENKPGQTGDVIPKNLKNQDEAIVVGPGATATITIGLDGFTTFRQGKYKGYHTLFEIDIPEFQIGASGEVIAISSENQKDKKLNKERLDNRR